MRTTAERRFPAPRWPGVGRAQDDSRASLTVSTPRKACSPKAPWPWGPEGLLAGNRSRRPYSASRPSGPTQSAPSHRPGPGGTCSRTKATSWPQNPLGRGLLARRKLTRPREAVRCIRGTRGRIGSGDERIWLHASILAFHTPRTGREERRGAPCRKRAAGLALGLSLSSGVA